MHASNLLKLVSLSTNTHICISIRTVTLLSVNKAFHECNGECPQLSMIPLEERVGECTQVNKTIASNFYNVFLFSTEVECGHPRRRFSCEKCGKTYSSAANLRRHQASYCTHDKVTARQKLSNASGNRIVDSKESERCAEISSSHSSSSLDQSHTCPICRKTFRSSVLLTAHSYTHTLPEEVYANDDGRIVLSRVAMDGLARDFELCPTGVVGDVANWLNGVFDLVDRVYSSLLTAFVVRSRIVLKVWFSKIDTRTGLVVGRLVFYISSYPASVVENVKEWYQHHVQGIKKNLENFISLDSDLILDEVELALFKINLDENLGGQANFKLPPRLQKTQSVINVDCNEACFKYALLSILHYDDIEMHRYRASKYRKWEGELDFTGVHVNEIHLSKDIPKIEKLNNLKINIHVWDKGLQGVVYNRRSVLAPRTVNLLLVVNEAGENHYCGIVSLSRLYYHTKKSHNMQHMCDRCCRSFTTNDILEEHYQWCSKGRLQIEQMPKERELTFTSFGHELMPVKVIYADIECFIEPEQNIHHPAAIACYEVWHPHFSDKQKNSKMHIWRGDICILNFLNKLEKIVREQHQRSNELTRNAMHLNDLQQREFDASTTCLRCKSAFDDVKHRKVRDHCHITGNYRGPLCHACNSKLRLKRRVLPVIFHNLEGYDGHMLIKGGLGLKKHWKLNVIAHSREKFMSLSAKIPVDKSKTGKTIYFDLVFIDSFHFLNSSLATLASNLDNLPLTNNMKLNNPSISNETIRRKGVFPYSYFSSVDKLNETSLPPREAFKNDLSGQECSEGEYAHAQRAWSEFKCKTFGDYMERYLELDVRLLADVFEEFRRVSLQEDGLDPVHFVSLPGLSFMSAFKKTDEKVHLLQDAEMYTMFERGIRGGLTFVNRHKVNEVNDIGNKNVHLIYIDENNLYGSALCKPLPHSDFTWVVGQDLQHFSNPNNIMNLSDESEWGYLFEVDLEYPSSIHDITADFPLAPESGTVTEEMFSPFMKDFYLKLASERGTTRKYQPTRKLLLTQYDKESYTVHYAILKFYLKMGMCLRTVRRAIRFRQKRWLEPYIKYNSERRALARNSFEKDYYKLKNNSLFGKTMEDVRKRIDYKLVTDVHRFQSLVRNPLFHDRDIISEDIVGVRMMKNKVVLGKPIYVGQAVLDYSKLEMYRLYYETLSECPLIKDIELVGGDTDSFFAAIHTDKHVAIDSVFKSLSHTFDSSNYPQNHPLFCTANKARLGCFKDETGGGVIEEMILLRPKMYSMKVRGVDNSIRRAKGISKSLVRTMHHSDYQAALEKKNESHVQMTVLRSNLHTVQTVTFRKRALSAWEDKRCWLTANTSLPHGHFRTGVPPPKRARVAVPPSGDIL